VTDTADRQLGRRDLLKRSALVGGALVWTTPIVQSIGGTALAVDGSPGGGNGAPSYVFVWFQCGTSFFVVKYDQNGSAEECGATDQHLSSDASAAVEAKFDVIYSSYGPYTDACPDGVTSGLSADGDLLVSLGASGCTVVNWLLHDGSCQKTGDDKFRWKGDGETPAVAFINPGGASWEFQKCND
jgi:hypothetical protein